MTSLQECHPNVYAEFIKGKFVVKKSVHALSLDQAHEQSNALVKGDGGAISFKLRTFASMAGPEMACLIEEYHISARKTQNIDLHHHEQKRHKQLALHVMSNP